MRRSIWLGLSILFLATSAWAQRRGAIGAHGAAGGFRGGTGIARPQTNRPSPARGNNSFRNRSGVSSLIGERFRGRRPFGFFPSYYNSYYPCANPYFFDSSYCPQFSPYGPFSYGAGPYEGYGSDPQDMADGEYQSGNFQAYDGGQPESLGVVPNPPRSSTFNRVDPRDVQWIIDGHHETSSAPGMPVEIGSGSHTLRTAVQNSEPLPPTKNPTE
jgi:hypothetical protein